MSFQFIDVPNHIESTGNPPTYTTNWKAVGEQSQTFVHSYTLSATPAVVSTIYGTLYRQDIRVRQVAYNHFTVQVPYGVRKNAYGDFTWDFDTTGATVHVSNAISEVGKFPSTAPDQKGAIRVNGDSVEGTDIVIPAMKVNVSYKHPYGQITLAQAKFLAGITGKVNSDTFLTFAPGEVLFLGARGSDGTDADATVAYQFAMSSNLTNETIGDITGVDKKGWEVAWIRYEDSVETSGGSDYPVRIPKFVYVDQVYRTVSMSTALGFGG